MSQVPISTSSKSQPGTSSIPVGSGPVQQPHNVREFLHQKPLLSAADNAEGQEEAKERQAQTGPLGKVFGGRSKSVSSQPFLGYRDGLFMAAEGGYGRKVVEGTTPVAGPIIAPAPDVLPPQQLATGRFSKEATPASASYLGEENAFAQGTPRRETEPWSEMSGRPGQSQEYREGPRGYQSTGYDERYQSRGYPSRQEEWRYERDYDRRLPPEERTYSREPQSRWPSTSTTMRTGNEEGMPYQNREVPDEYSGRYQPPSGQYNRPPSGQYNQPPSGQYNQPPSGKLNWRQRSQMEQMGRY